MSVHPERKKPGNDPPIYRRIEAALRARIESGELKPGDPLPSNRALCEQFGGVNHLTVRQALKCLKDAKLIFGIQGKGTFVSRPPVRHHRIALVLPNIEDHLTARIAAGVHRIMDSNSCRTLLLDSRRDLKAEIDNIRHIRELPIDGAIIFPSPEGHIAEELVALKQAGFPFVLVDRIFSDIRTNSVVVENYRGGYDVTRHLISRGRTKFAWAGHLNVSAATERYQGFRDALNDSEIALDRHLVFGVTIRGLSYEQWFDHIADTISARRDTVDAVVCVNDGVALLLVEKLLDKGFSVPADIAVTGFDDMPEARRSNPPLTSVRQDSEIMGAEAASLLLAQIQDPTAPFRQVVLPVEMVIRSSS